MNKEFDITAILAVRNGSFYFNRLCRHLRENGIKLVVIDNESTDGIETLIDHNSDIIEEYSILKYKGYFDLHEQLEAKKNAVEQSNSQWIMHIDVDELIHSDIEGETLLEALKRIDTSGANTVNCNEFVFLPHKPFGDYTSDNFDLMRYYYFFEPIKNRLLRIFKKNEVCLNPSSGGHSVQGDIKLYEQNFPLLHYIFPNKKELSRKYLNRNYAPTDIKKGFHKNRAILQGVNSLKLPNKKLLKRRNYDSTNLDYSNPYKKHFWQWS